MVWGYLPQTAALTMFALYMGMSKVSMMASVVAAATAVNPVVYSIPAFILSSGTMTTMFFPSDLTWETVPSPSYTWTFSLTSSAILSAFLTRGMSISFPLMITPPPVMDPVLRAFSIPARLTAQVLLVRDTIFLIALLRNGLMASNGMSFAMRFPLSSYKSITSSYFGISYLLVQ